MWRCQIGTGLRDREKELEVRLQRWEVENNQSEGPEVSAGRMPQQRVGLESPAPQGLGGHRCLAKELGLHRKGGQSTEEYEIVKQPVKELQDL